MTRSAAPLALCVVLASLSGPVAVSAQRTSSGFGVGTTGVTLSERLGETTMSSWSGTGIFGIQSGGQIEVRFDRFPEALTDIGDLRAFQLNVPQVGWRQRLVGRGSNLGWTLGAGMYVNSLRRAGASPAQRISLPFLTTGLGVQLAVAGPIHVDLRGGVQAAMARQNAFGIVTGPRGLATTPWIQVSALALFRKSPPALPAMDAGMGGERNFIPVTPSAVPSQVAQTIARTAEPIRPLVRSDRPMKSQMMGQIQYGIGSTAVPPTAFPMLERVAAYLEQNPASMLELVAFTDPLGGIATNQSVAERRGTEVREHLVRLLGVAEDRIVVRAMGHDPVAPRAEARRVEIFVLTPSN